MIYISLTASSLSGIEDAIIDLVKQGFSDIELSGGKEYCTGLGALLPKLKKKYNLNFLVHNYFPPSRKPFMMNIASKEADIREDSFSLVEKAIVLSNKLGSNLYSIHPGHVDNVYIRDGKYHVEANSLKNNGQDFYRGLNELLEKIKGRNVRVAIENTFPYKGRWHSQLESRENIVDFLGYCEDKPNLGLLLDLGHLNLASSYLGFDKNELAEMIFADHAHKIFEVHASENDGSNDLHHVSEPDSWQIDLLFKNKEKLVGVPIVFEWQKAAKNTLRQNFTKLRGLLC